MSNHVSYLDPVIIGTAANREIHYMTRHDIFEIPLLNRLVAAHNAYPVKRGAADLSALRHTIALLKSGKAVLIFPEGTRSADGSLGKAHDGASFIAYNAEVPAIPVYIKGAEQLMPRDARCIHPTKLSVTFGPPLDFTELRKISDRRELYRCMGEQVMLAIAELRDKQAKQTPER